MDPNLVTPPRGSNPIVWLMRNQKHLDALIARVVQLSNHETVLTDQNGAVTRIAPRFTKENVRTEITLPSATNQVASTGNDTDEVGGDVFGPDSSVFRHIAVYGNGTGKKIIDSGVNLDDIFGDGIDYFTDIKLLSSFAVASTSVAFTAIPFDSPVANPYTIWNISQPTRLTVTVSGRYTVAGWLRFAANATGARGTFLRTNSQSINITSCVANTTPGDPTYLGNAGIVDLSVGDYVELACYQTSGGSLNVLDAQIRLVKLNVRGAVSEGGGGDSFDVSKIVVSGGNVVCSNGEVVTSGA